MSIQNNLKGLEVECDKCKKLIGKNNYKRHYISCDGSGIPKRKRRNNGKGQNWNKGKTNVEIYGKEKATEISEKISISVKNKPFVKHSEESKKKISQKMLNNKNWVNSLNKTGKGKKGHYKGNYFASSWELAYIIFCEKNNINIKRNWKSFKYINANNEEKLYIPDFYSETEDKFIEIKGYVSEDAINKINYFPFKIEMIEKEKIKHILKYIIDKYGKNFYEKLKDI
jgi:hypothetical protein